MKIETWDARHYTREQATAIARLLVATWPKPDKTVETRAQTLLERGRGYTGPDEMAPRSFVIRQGDEVVAHAGLLPRTVSTPTGELVVAGLNYVCAAASVRGAGLGKRIVLAVFDLVDAGVFPVSLFQTNHTIRPFYERMGCCLVENRFFNSLGEDPNANPFADEIVMRYPAEGSWPEGDIDLLGPGF